MKISELCFLVGIDDILHEKVRNTSFSQQKFIEIIRAVVQLPYLIMVDDIDLYFDEVNYAKAIEVLRFAISSGSSVLLSSKKKLPNVDRTLKIQTSAVVEL
jgi:ABC-type branched-subunit amino acid transport system ATPase component